MSDFHAIAGKAAGILALAAYVPYGGAILKKETRPNLATWLIWAVMDVLIVGSYYSSGARDTLWLAIGFAIGSITIVALALKYGESDWNKLDIVCLIGAGISIPFWVISGPLIALLINLLVTIIGSIPTIQKAFSDPASENKLAWKLFLISAVTNLFAVKKWEFAIAIYPVVIFLLDGLISIPILLHRKQPAK